MEEEEAGCLSKCKRGMWSWKECKDCHVQKCENIEEGTPSAVFQEVPEVPVYGAAVKGLDVSALVSDLEKVTKDSKDCWPADFGHYGLFFVPLAWHCSGTYRESDCKGGCA